MVLHPAKAELLALAESAVDHGIAVSAKTAAHVAECDTCAAEVEAMRATVAFVAESPALEPSSAQTSAILLAAKEQRRRSGTRANVRGALSALGRGIGYAAAVAVMTALCFGAALGQGAPGKAAPLCARAGSVEAAPDDEHIDKVATDIQTLAADLRAASSRRMSPEEAAHRKAALALDADIAEALAALERNPGFARANDMVSSNLQRQAERLRTLYAARKL